MTYIILCVNSYIAEEQVAIGVVRLIDVGRNDVRPIAIGEVLRRGTAKAICSQSSTSFLSFFAPIQHGIAMPGGAEFLVHHIQLLLEYHSEWAVLKTDVEKAFNSVSRISLMQQVAKNSLSRGSNVWTAEQSDLSKRWFKRNSAISWETPYGLPYFLLLFTPLLIIFKNVTKMLLFWRT